MQIENQTEISIKVHGSKGDFFLLIPINTSFEEAIEVIDSYKETLRKLSNKNSMETENERSNENKS